MNNWNWHPKRPIGETVLGLFGKKKFVYGIVTLAVLLGGVALAEGPLFHGYHANPACIIEMFGNPCQDPTTLLWQRTNGQPAGVITDFNLAPGASEVFDANCDLLGAGQDCISLNNNLGGNSSVAISKAPINDISVALSKTMGILGTFKILSALNANTGRSNGWGYFLTTNNTAPTHTLGKTSKWDPFTDPNTVEETVIYCTSGTCGGSGGTGTYNVEVFVRRHTGTNGTLSSENPGGCNSGGSCFMTTVNTNDITGCQVPGSCTGGNIMNIAATYLNFTGSTTPTTTCTISSNVLQGSGCSWICASYSAITTLQINKDCSGSPVLPANPFGAGQFFYGVFSLGPSNIIEWEFQPGTPPALGGTNGMEVTAYVPGVSCNVAGSSNGQVCPNIPDAGFFGPVIDALVVIGIFILNAILAFIGFIAPAIQSALAFLESLIRAVLDLIGNALGFGNVGTTLFSLLGSIVTFFTNSSYGFPAFFGFFATYITNFLRYLQIDFQFLTPVFTLANAILIFGVNGIAEAFVIFLQGVNMLFFGYGTFMVFAYFLYVGDDGIGGLFTFLGTLEAISFKILNSIVTVTNVGLDFLVTVVSLVPKPLIQMSAARIPRLPTVEYAATMSFPTLDFGEARNGNLIVYWLWCMGLWFMAWFESQNPALPGSLVAIDPALATNVRNLSAYIPLLQAATLISGGLVLAWFCLLPMRLAGIDVTEAPVGASLGRRTGPGPSSVRFTGSKKHVVGPAKKAAKELERRKGFKGKKEEEAKKDIEKQKREIEEKKRSEELRKQELARKPTGKDLKGPNLGPLGPQ